MPDFKLLELLGFGGTGLTVTLAVLGLFWRADEAFSDEFRDLVARRLQGMTIETGRANWPQSFARMFDRVFGIRHLSWKCLTRSCIASGGAVLLLTSLSMSIHPTEYFERNYFQAGNITVLFLIVMSFNFIPDYISLLETRYVIKLITRYDSTPITLALLAFDLIITIAIFLFVGVGLFILVTGDVFYFQGSNENIRAILSMYIGALDLFKDELLANGLFLTIGGDSELPVGIFFYSTLFTSAWVWLLTVGWFFVRNAARFRRGLELLKFALPIKTKPMRAVGEVAAIVTALAFIVLGVFGVGFEPDSTAAIGLPN